MLHEVRGKGLMIGLEFGQPTSRRLCGVRWNALERIRPALFSQLIVVPLFHRHRILTQVAADNVNIIKLLPPLIAGEEEVDYFVDALDDVLADAHKRLRPALRVRDDDGQGRAPAGRAGTNRRRRPVTTARPMASAADAATATPPASTAIAPLTPAAEHPRPSV